MTTADPVAVMDRLGVLATELDRYSHRLSTVEREFCGYSHRGEHVMGAEEAYENWLDVFVRGLWDRHVHDGAKFPSEEVRLRMARLEMPALLVGRYSELKGERRRLENRIRDIGKEVEAQRSILSALKVSAEADGSSLVRA